MKRPEQVYKEVATELNLPMDVVKEVSETFWRYGREQLNNPQQQGVYFPYLGEFYTNPAILFTRLTHYIYKLRLAKHTNTFGPKTDIVIKECTVNIRKMWKVKNEMGWRFTGKKPHTKIKKVNQ